MMKEKRQLLSAGFLLGVTHRRAVALLQHRLRDYDITPEQWSVLYHVTNEEGMIQKSIAEQTFKDKPTVTRILHQLEQKGYIVRKADQIDRRSLRIYSTERGRSLITETESIEESISQEVINCLGEQGHEQLVQSLNLLNSYLSEVKLAEEEE